MLGTMKPFISKAKTLLKKVVRRNRLTGFSLFGVGGEWEVLPAEEAVVERLFVDFEDRRVLYQKAYQENPRACIVSVDMIRSQLTAALKDLLDSRPSDAGISDHIEDMHAACLEFLESVECKWLGVDRLYGDERELDPCTFVAALEKLRTVFGVNIRSLSVKCGINVRPRVSSIVPHCDPS